MTLVIDNYDSFTYNLINLVAQNNPNFIVVRNDKISIEEIETLNPQAILISPGPKRPIDAGLSLSVIKKFCDKIPIFGVCLGHQAIGEIFGGKISYAKKIMHGKVSQIFHDEKTIFKNLENPFIATRYHSLAIDENFFPKDLEISARSDDGEIMAIRHKKFNIEGVQFHPESILTIAGEKIFQNWFSTF